MQDSYILIISHDIVGQHMAGPGIRYYHLAQVLSQYFSVVLAIPAASPELPFASFPSLRYAAPNWEALAPLTAHAKVVVVSNVLANILLPLVGQVPVVIDGYDPLLAENLAFGSHLPKEQLWAVWRAQAEALRAQYQLGDFYICASERQRDWWLGLLEASGRINPATVQTDLSLRKLLDVVPFGLPARAPSQTNPIIKGVWEGIAANDMLLIWGGGLWPWLDPFTAIHAVACLASEWPSLRLVFPGTRHPNTNVAQDVPTHNEAARALAINLGLLDKYVFFGDWIPYADWGAVLLESSIAITLHFDTYETRLAFRSRVLEYVWAGLPIVATAGDATSELIAHYQLGWIVPPNDVEAVVKAIRLALTQTLPKVAFEAAKTDLTWERAAQPLVSFCRNPYFANDIEYRLSSKLIPYENEKLRQELAQAQSDLQVYKTGRIARILSWVERQKQRLGFSSKGE